MPILKIKTQVKACFQEKAEGKYHDDQAVSEVLSYVLREDKARYIGGISVNPQMAQDQFRIVAEAYGKNYGVRLRHMILSFSPDEKITVEDAHNIAYQAALYYGYQYQIVWACHTDGKCIHIHFVMNMVGYATGMKYDGSKADYYGFLEHMKRVLSPYGMRIKNVEDISE